MDVRGIIISVGLGLTLGFAVLRPASAADCTCRAKDVVASEGQTVCLVTPSGPRLAICEKVLNNTSWRFLGDGCGLEVTRLPELVPADASTVAMSPASELSRRLDALHGNDSGQVAGTR